MDDELGRTMLPSRYETEDGKEAIDLIRESLGDIGFVAFCQGNAMKYEIRAGKKGDGKLCIEKMKWYLEMSSHVLTGSADPRSYRTR